MKLSQQEPEWQRESIRRNLKLSESGWVKTSMDENQMKSQTSKAARRGN
jgi:hypothetical protein